MKYRVLKPLPRAKVGDVLERPSTSEHLFLDPYAYPIVYQDSLKYALSEGFIEEIKEETRWEPSANDDFWYLDEDCEIYQGKGQFYSETHYVAVFKSRETAELVATAQKLMYEYLHTPKAYKGRWSKIVDAIELAREACLADDRSTS